MGGACSQKLKSRRGLPSSSGRFCIGWDAATLTQDPQSASKNLHHLAFNLWVRFTTAGVGQIWGGSFLPSAQGSASGSFSQRGYGWGIDLAGCHHGGATVSDAAATKSASPTVLSLAQLLEQQPSSAPPCLVEPGLLPPQGILFVGGEPKVGKSLLVANLALALAAGIDRLGFSVPAQRRVLICQFELPVPQFVSRLSLMRRALGAAADQHLLVDTRASGHLLS